MEAIQGRVESWIREQRERMMTSWGRVQWRMRWPPWNTAIGNGRGDRKRIQQEFERRKRQLHQLCLAVKVDSVSDLQEILCCMVLSECVYKRPATEMVRAVNKFKADFGGELVSLERVQPSSDHVPHRYLLAEAGDTLFASFIGTKQYKDVMADVNILQGAVFHEDAEEEFLVKDVESSSGENGKVNGDLRWNPLESKAKNIKGRPKPAAHRGFLARAKGIPALELYRLAQKKNRKLVLCGHSLGGAVAALATLAILRVVATSSSSKETEKFQVKCITFSQPPVGNASLRDYVHRKGWQHYFKSYCIPEDVVPRMLSPAYFHHYNAQPLSANAEAEAIRQSELKQEEGFEYSRGQKLKENGGEPLVLGLGPVQTSFWRLSRLVPLEGLRKQFNKNTPKTVDPIEASSSSMFSTDDAVAEPQSLEIQEGSDGISLKPLIDSTIGSSDEAVSGKSSERKEQKYGDRREWRKVPALPSYVPFGKLYLLGESSVDLLSGAEYSKLTSVRSVIAELRERFQSHSMRSYRSRFHRIFEMCMGEGGSSFVGMDKLPQFPHLHQWLGLSIAGAAELAQIAESPVIRTATSLVPLGWSGVPGDKNGDPLKVDIMGFRLHLCSLIYAQVNGNWCSTTVESCPSTTNYSANHEGDAELQRIRISVGAPLKRPPRHLSMADVLVPVFPSIDSETVGLNSGHIFGPDGKSIRPEGLCNFSIYCINDFTTVSKEVHVRTRRVRLIGLEGAGKTSLFKALMNQRGLTSVTNFENLHKECEVKESIAGGICYSDSDGINLQDLKLEVSRFRDELWMGIRDLSRKTDLIILVHNLSHKIPRWSNSSGLRQQPVLSLLLDEAKALGVPWILAITNKFSVSAHQQKAAIDAILQTYQASLSTSEVVNSCPYVMPTAAASASLSLAASEEDVNRKNGAQNLIYSPISLVLRPFQKKDIIFPVDGVDSLCKLAHRVLRSHEEDSLQELANDRLLAELELERALSLDANKRSQEKSSSVSAAAVGASLGAGLGLVLAIVMGAASALRKP